MMKLILLAFLATSLQSCGGCQRDYTRLTGQLTEKCHKGILFVQSDSGIAVLPDADGKPTRCEK